MYRLRRKPQVVVRSSPRILLSPPSPPFLPRISLPLALTLLLTLRFISAVTIPISDCDETFNYWEPLHYLTFHHGLQTWEYSPVYALRSYAYLLPYKPVIHIAGFLHRFLPSLPSQKIFSFYLIRLTLAATSAFAEVALYSSTRHRFGNDVSTILLVLLAFSPGVSRAASELLPSSFAMITLTAAFSFWIRQKFFPAVFLVALASLLGWIYAAAMALPLAVDLLCRPQGFRLFFLYAAFSGVPTLVLITLVDSFYYGKLILPPLNHVLYNVFPKEGAGSHLFGVESILFYVTNLALNCNLSVLLLALFPLLCILQAIIAFAFPQNSSQMWSRLPFLIPPYLWLAVLGSQPHKEERFLTPCYTFISLVAAVTFVDGLDLILQFAGIAPYTKEHIAQKRTSSRHCNASFIAKRLLTAVLLVSSAALGISRSVMQVKGFQAPLLVYQHLSEEELQNGAGPRQAPQEYTLPFREVNVCIGKEWYRFPNSFFLPNRRFRIRFIRSGFSGLMPKPFEENGFGTRVIPSGMNEFNKEDPSQYYDWNEGEGCHYFVDLDLSHRRSEPAADLYEQLPIPEESRHVVFNRSFLDSESSRPVFRAFYVPGFENKLVYGHYQLIRNLDLLPYAR